MPKVDSALSALIELEVIMYTNNTIAGAMEVPYYSISHSEGIVLMFWCARNVFCQKFGTGRMEYLTYILLHMHHSV